MRTTLLSLAAGAALAVSGCGYTFHQNAFFRSDVKTIALEIFDNDTFRRDLEFPLTETIKDRIQSLTPYRLEIKERADTLLRGRITAVREHVISENKVDQPIESSVSIEVKVEWIDLRSGKPLVPPFQVNDTSTFVLLLGGTRRAAQDDTFSDLADEIVRKMEIPWDKNPDVRPDPPLD